MELREKEDQEITSMAEQGISQNFRLFWSPQHRINTVSCWDQKSKTLSEFQGAKAPEGNLVDVIPGRN